MPALQRSGEIVSSLACGNIGLRFYSSSFFMRQRVHRCDCAHPQSPCFMQSMNIVRRVRVQCACRWAPSLRKMSRKHTHILSISLSLSGLAHLTATKKMKAKNKLRVEIFHLLYTYICIKKIYVCIHITYTYRIRCACAMSMCGKTYASKQMTAGKSFVHHILCITFTIIKIGNRWMPISCQTHRTAHSIPASSQFSDKIFDTLAQTVHINLG